MVPVATPTKKSVSAVLFGNSETETTVATAWLLLDQVTSLPGNGLPAPSRTVATRSSLSPTSKIPVDKLISTDGDATGGAATVMSAFATTELPSLSVIRTVILCPPLPNWPESYALAVLLPRVPCRSYGAAVFSPVRGALPLRVVQIKAHTHHPLVRAGEHVNVP